ncbi:MAG: ABC transporter permease, partial [Candidatus Hydrogenedentes bacterium]|nr:ABC transporter permease [Candidatus Hydrogenedentota bacterium]
WIAAGIIVVPMTFIIATGGIDLSVASILALSAMVMGLVFRDLGLPIYWAAVCAVLTGLAAGAFNGGMSSYLRIPPLVVTLATMTLYRGIAMGLSRARPVGDFPEGFQWLGQGDLFQIPGTSLSPVYIPVSLLVLIAVFAVGWVLMHKSWAGRYAELIGENETAARFSGIDVPLVKCLLFTACGGLCGLAAIFHTAFYATAKADTAMGMELEAIACVVIGGARISGGRASMSGALLGLLIIGILRFGLEMSGVQSRNIIIIVGLVLIVTAVVNERFGNRQTGE